MMWQIEEPENVMLVTGFFSQHNELLQRTSKLLIDKWGAAAEISEALPFNFTTYYKDDTGADLKYQMIAFKDLIHPSALVDIKLASNEIEKDLAKLEGYPEKRPVNIDPGYLSIGKFVLSTTKNAFHRLYLDKNIYADLTLYYADKDWQGFDWTYLNFRDQRYKDFLSVARQYYLHLTL